MAALLGAVVLAAINPDAGLGVLTAVQAAQVQKQINFTRGNEREADRIGIQLLHKAGYETEAMADFFQRLQTANRYNDPKYIPEILRTHPVTVNRISEARERAEQLPQDDSQGKTASPTISCAPKLSVAAARDPAIAKQVFKNRLQAATFAEEALARYGYVLALTEAGDFAEARVEVDKLISASPGVISFRLAAGRVEQRAGDYNAALEHFKFAYEMDPTSRAATYGYANSLTLAGQPEAARKLLRSYAAGSRQDPKFFKLIAEAETKMGRGREVAFFARRVLPFSG